MLFWLCTGPRDSAESRIWRSACAALVIARRGVPGKPQLPAMPRAPGLQHSVGSGRPGGHQAGAQTARPSAMEEQGSKEKPHSGG